MSQLLRTADYFPAERVDYWRHVISSTFVPLDVPQVGAERFRASIHAETFGALQVADVRADGHVVRRSPQLISRTPADYYKLGLQQRGYCVVSQDGREAPLTPGDFAIYDTTRPYELAFDDTFRMLVLMFPRRLLRVPATMLESMTATRISGRHGMAALVAPFLVELATRLDDIDPAVSLRLADNVIDILATLVSQQLGTPTDSGDTIRRSLMLQIKSFIEARLGDPDLDADTIARAHHISTRYLHKLFQEQGFTVGRHIRQRRLEQCSRDLADPAQAHRSVAGIAAGWGILDAPRFSRLFRDAFGCSPREYRSEKLAALHDPTAYAPAQRLPDGVCRVHSRSNCPA